MESASGSSRALAEWAANLKYEDLPEVVVDRAQGLMLDYLGLAVLGSTREHCRKWRNIEAELGSREGGTCGVIGTGLRLAADRAAFLNGVSGSSAPNLDDVWHGSLGHPGVGTFPALFAVGEAFDVGGRDALLGAVVGYEISMRVGSAVGRSSFNRGWHPRGGCNTIGASVAALKVLGEGNADVFLSAIGLSANAASGTVGSAYFSDAWFALSGNASREGLLAALAARSGLVGTVEPLTGERGYLAATSDEPDASHLTAELGTVHMLLRAGQKLYPSSGATHAALEATVQAVRELDCSFEDIERIDGYGFREMVHVLGQPYPENSLAASMSTPYVIACAARFGGLDLKHLDAAMLHDKDLFRLQSVVNLSVDDRLDGLPPRHLGARVKVRTRNGREATVEILSASGHDGNPLTFRQVARKIDGLLRECWPSSNVSRLIELTERAESVSVGEILAETVV